MLTDKRARLRAKPGLTTPFNGPASVLANDREMVFPHTPTIAYSRQVGWGSYDLPHTNYQPLYWQQTRSPNIQVTALFTNTTPEEHEYTNACLHFLRVCSLGHFGINDPLRGSPPPVLEFSAYGANQFANVPVCIGSVSYTLDSDVDYVEQASGRNSTGANVNNNQLDDSLVLPAQLFVAIDLMYQPNLTDMRETFTAQDIANGSLLTQGFL